MPDVEPGRFAAGIVGRSKSSFTFAMQILGSRRRDAMFAVYAFARTIDDIADGPWPADEKLRLLAAWRADIDRLFAGRPEGLIARALAGPVARFGLPREEFILMIEGMERDSAGPVRLADIRALLDYTRRVAGTVGMLSVRIFGVPDGPARDRFALDLADAFQLTNILRDVEEDARLDRLYLPADLLEAHGVTTADPGAVAAHPGLVGVCREIGELARKRFAAARAAIPALDTRRMRPALMMMGVYEGYLDKLEAAEWRRDIVPVTMSRPEKLWRGVRHAYFAGAW